MIIVIEGGDQAGKKTQSELLAKALKARKLKTKIFSFPDYSTPIGKKIFIIDLCTSSFGNDALMTFHFFFFAILR